MQNIYITSIFVSIDNRIEKTKDAMVTVPADKEWDGRIRRIKYPPSFLFDTNTSYVFTNSTNFILFY